MCVMKCSLLLPFCNASCLKISYIYILLPYAFFCTWVGLFVGYLAWQNSIFSHITTIKWFTNRQSCVYFVYIQKLTHVWDRVFGIDRWIFCIVYIYIIKCMKIHVWLGKTFLIRHTQTSTTKNSNRKWKRHIVWPKYKGTMFWCGQSSIDLHFNVFSRH